MCPDTAKRIEPTLSMAPQNRKLVLPITLIGKAYSPKSLQLLSSLNIVWISTFVGRSERLCLSSTTLHSAEEISDTGAYCLRLFDLHQHLAVQTFK